MCEGTKLGDYDCDAMGQSLGSSVTSRRATQMSWLVTILHNIAHRRQPGDWIFVFGHHSPFSVGPHGNNLPLHADVLPLLHAYGVNVYFAGHDHTMQHLSQNVSATIPVADLPSALADTSYDASTHFDTRLYNGFHFFISGGGGADLNDDLDHRRAEVGSPFAGGPVTVQTALIQFGVSQIVATAKSLVVEILDTRSETTYRALISKNV